MIVFSILAISSLFFIGLFFGSFLNVVIDRLPKNESIVRGRSHCESCNHILSWIDLIPLLSYFSTNGKCRYCHVALSLKYPLFEVVTGVLFAESFYVLAIGKGFESLITFPFILNVIYSLYILSSFLIIFFIDLEHGFIPDKIVYPGIIVSLIYLLFVHFDVNFLLAALAAFIFFYAIYFFTKKRGMGFGDVKLAILLGLFLGFPKIVIALYIAFLTGAAISLILVIAKKKKFHGGSIPFGPFMVIGALIAFFLR